ncbi:MAG: hypothetical protein ACYC5M_01940 [Anaerolineae bacterium]
MSLLRFLRKTSVVPEGTITHHSIVTWETGKVCASVLELGEGSAQLLGVSTAPVQGIGGKAHPDVDRWTAGCDKALTQAEDMTQASARRKLVPDYVTMSVPPEVTRNVPVVVTQVRPGSQTGITFDELRRLLQRGYRQAQDVIGAHGKQASEDIVAGSVAEIVVDGRQTLDPLGLRAEQIALRMNFSLVPYDWLRALDVVSERLELRLAGIVPQHMAYASPLTDPGALLILLDQEYSVLCTARYGRIEWSAVVDIGARAILRDTAAALSLREQQVPALMQAYRGKQLREEVDVEVARAFWTELRRWMDALAECVRASAPQGSTPHRIYFLDVSRSVPEACDSLNTPFWERRLPFGRCPEVSPYCVGTVRDVLDCTAQAGGIDYLPVRALARHVAQVYSSVENLDRAMAEVVHWRRPPSPLGSR